MTNQRRDKDGKYANGPVSPPPSPAWAEQVIAEAEALNTPPDRYAHMLAALRSIANTQPAPPTEVLCESCKEPIDSQAHVTACDIVTLTKQRKRDGEPVGTTKAEHENLTSGVTPAELDVRETAMAAEPRRRSGPTASSTARVPDGKMQVGDVLKVHADADGQPITFEYKIVTRKPKTVVIRMIRADGTLGEPRSLRVKKDESGTEFIALSQYQWAFAPAPLRNLE